MRLTDKQRRQRVIMRLRNALMIGRHSVAGRCLAFLLDAPGRGQS